MKIQAPYLDRTFSLEFPDENLLALAEPNDFAGAGSPEQILRKALAQPIGPGGGAGQSLGDFLKGASGALILINDATRPTPTEAILRGILPFLEKENLLGENLTLLAATGAHRPPTEPEYQQILGEFYPILRSRCVSHECRKEADLVDLGKTRNGTPIVLNKRLFERDRIIVTGSVEPHYFAGFTGGRKAFLPGIAAYRTIEANHKQALSPQARSLALQGNPVHEDMMDALPLIKAPVFSCMTVLDKEQRIAAAACGDLIASFDAAVRIAQQIFCVLIPETADIVVSVAKFPMDIDLYQSQKALDNGGAALKDGGFLLLISSCRDGIGDETYAKLLAQAASPGDALERIRESYKLGYHKAAKMAEISRRAAVQAVTELSGEQLKPLFIEKISTPQEGLDKALETLRRRGIRTPKILILPDGCVTVPMIKRD